MRITVLNACDMTSSLWARWRSLQNENEELNSPYFNADFARIVAAVRDGLFVAVLGPRAEPQGFFPYQRRRFGFGDPAGSRLSDFHGLIARRDLYCDVPELMRACRLVSWEFHALLASQAAFAPYHARTTESHYLDTATGLEGYEAGLRQAGSSQPRKLRVFRRKANEAFKKVEFVAHVSDVRVLDTLLAWKSRQYRSVGAIDNWSFPWMRELIYRIHAAQGDDFAGMLSALYFDGELAAAHMGMRSRDAWHWWFPRHAEKFEKYFPGLLLLYLAIEHAPRLGVRRIDLGYGDEEFKRRLRSGFIPVAAGRIEIPSLVLSVKRWRDGLESWVRRTPLLPVLRIPGRLVKGLEFRSRYR
ncbi:MAG: GNAT family N-acetyltransferase [Planctomycetes bacterium]|nr:GNAT family N-acetyltransferase [Planctomycetota bacterium]